MTFRCCSLAMHKVYYKGEGCGGFPQVQLWWVLWVHICLWLVRAPKCSNYALTNLFGLCRYVRVIKLLINLPSPIPKLQHALLPPKWCKLRSAPQLFLFPLFSPLGSQLSPSRSLGVHQWTFHTPWTNTTKTP